jgi:hypothetical protein
MDMLKKKLHNKKCRKIIEINEGYNFRNGKCLFKSYYMLILMYGAETLTWMKADTVNS